MSPVFLKIRRTEELAASVDSRLGLWLTMNHEKYSKLSKTQAFVVTPSKFSILLGS